VRRGERLRVTTRGRAIAEIVPPSTGARESDAARARLRGSVLQVDRPTDPVLDPGEWDVNR
jgi:antitoxin (DNA-binding transcriptional repressor) of toxin-antitoxin stability system